MLLRELIKHLEQIAPLGYQESYDNAGLITGNPDQEITGVLVCLDSTEAVIKEAIDKKCNVVIAHHPIVFKGLKKITGRTYVERTIIQAIKADLAIYAIHTNLDNVFQNGVNGKIAEKIGLNETRILAPKRNLLKLSALIPSSQLKDCRMALMEAGVRAASSHHIEIENLDRDETALVNGAYTRLSALLTAPEQERALNIMKQFSDRNSISCEFVEVQNSNSEVGSGMIGTLAEPMSERDFLKHVKTVMQLDCIRHTELLGKPVRRVAICGGAGGFLLPQAIGKKADFFITADYKYHEFFDAEGKIVIADIGHYESEQYTIELLSEIISQKFSTFAVHCTKVATNPVRYFIS